MLIEDDTDVREVIRDAIADDGHDVIAVADGRAALDYLGSNPAPCLILLDWHMRGMTGVEFTAELIRTPGYAKAPIVLMSADARVTGQLIGVQLAGYLPKPFELEELLALVDYHCSTKRGRTAAA
jgi:DNA-binding response OmpR family regulator